MRRFLNGLVLHLALVVGMTAAAQASQQLVLGKLFLVKDPVPGGDAAKRRIVVVGKEVAPGDGDTIIGDPTAVDGGGAFVEVVANRGATNQSEVYPLPAPGWKRVPPDLSKPLAGYTYSDPAPGAYGPVRKALIKTTATGRFLVKVILAGSNGPGPQPHINVLPPDPGTDGGATLTFNNGDSYCVMFGSEAGGRVLNKPSSVPQSKVFRVASTVDQPTVETGCVAVHCPIPGEDAGDCCEAHDGLGCSDRECCHRVSAQNHMCGTSGWSGECVRIANAVCTTCGGTPDVCGNGFVEGIEECDPPDGISCASDCTRIAPTCGLASDSCCTDHASPGCADQACCETVCDADPRCCWFGWDASCAAEAATLCGTCPGSACGAFVGACCAEHDSAGCDDAACCQTVCDVDSSCCRGEWDAACAALAGQVCAQCNAPVCPAPGGCFGAHGNPGCNQTSCCEQVCALQPACCTATWDGQCASLAAQECDPFVGSIDVEVNNTLDAGDDYLTWSPTIARMRVRDREPNSDLTVVVRNAAANGTGGRGELVFKTYARPPDQWPADWPVNTTATDPTITLTLPRDASWVGFVVAGRFGPGPFGKASDGANGVKGRDTVIEVHDGAADGPVLKTHAVMVRVRKNVGRLSAAERDRFVTTLKALHKTEGKYQVLQDMHRDGAAFEAVYVDFIHDNPAFIPWHRAQLLDLERRLQAVDPAVTVPYWNSDGAVPAGLFTEAFMSAIDPAACQPVGTVRQCASGADAGKACHLAKATDCTGDGVPHPCCDGAGMAARCRLCAGAGVLCAPQQLKQCTSGTQGGLSCDFTAAGECTGPLTPRPCCTGAGTGPGCATCAGGATCAPKQWCKLKGNFSEAEWTVKLNGAATPVRRVKHAFTGTPTEKAWSTDNSGPFKLALAEAAIKVDNYIGMRRLLEANIHNLAHMWVGGVNENMESTVIDPAFFLFHCNHDRIWARWQAYDPENRGFAAPRAYSPQGVFNPNASVTKMAYLGETFWPWNGLKRGNGNCANAGCGTTTPPCCSNRTTSHCATAMANSNECPDWPATVPGGAGFPAGLPNLGPGATPKVRDVIDYEGRADPTKGLGYCYDDTAY